jgi:hypothetical protein
MAYLVDRWKNVVVLLANVDDLHHLLHGIVRKTEALDLALATHHRYTTDTLDTGRIGATFVIASYVYNE